MKESNVSRLRNERGVAMVTVLFVGAALTVMTTTAAFLAVKGLRATSADKSSTQALAAAEAGLERFMLDVERGAVSYATMKEAGCASAPLTLPPGTLGPGTYNVALTIYEPTQNPKVPADPWTAANDTAVPCSTRTGNLFAVTATGTQGSGTRVVRQVIMSTPGESKFPLGIYADNIDANGNPDMDNISVFTRGDVVGRSKISLSGTDSNYQMEDVYNPTTFSSFVWSGGLSWTSPIPAAVHATGEIYAKNTATRGREHPFSSTQTVNCVSNDTRNGGYALQSEWDSSACSGCTNSGNLSADTCGGLPGYPPTARFTQADLDRIAQVRNFTEDEYATLKSSAQASGIYCQFATNQCWTNGVVGAAKTNWGTGDLAGITTPSLIAYFEWPYSSNTSGNSIKWTATWKALSGVMCNPTNPADNRTAVIVVRNGSFDLGGTANLTGAILTPEGNFDSSGTPILHGSVTAKAFRVRGNAKFESSNCFASSLPTTSTNLSLGGWSEIDR